MMKTLRPISANFLFAAPSKSSPICRNACLQQRRTFVSNPFSGPQTLVATRTLPYPSKVIYDIISDVASYSKFLPYCQESVVTRTSSAAPDGKTYPEEARLLIGFNDSVSESFVSRIYCVPERVVEAVSGQTETTLHPDDIAHHSPRPTSAEEDPSRKDAVLQHLLTRWTLRPYPFKPGPHSALHPETSHKAVEETSDLPAQEKTEVSLAIDYQFVSPVYAALSSAAAPRIADKMVEAFERRVQAVVQGPGSVHVQGRRGEGVIKAR